MKLLLFSYLLIGSVMSCSGVLGSMFSFLQYLTSPVIGAISDVYGRKPVMIITSVTMATVI